VTLEIGIVFGILLAAGVLFAAQRVPNDIAALGIAVCLALLEPWTGVTPRDAIAGLANPATVTVLAMFILSDGVRRTGVVHRIGRWIRVKPQHGPRRHLALTLALGGPPAALINNTPLVGVLTPLVVDFARRGRISPSTLLMPLSFASMMGGMLTLIGTSTNLLASDLAQSLLGRPLGMFEFTHLGLLVLVAGSLYLLAFGPYMTPERIPAEQDLTEKFGLRSYLHTVGIAPGATVIGQRIDETQRDQDWDLDILQIARGANVYIAPTTDQCLADGDRLTIRAARATVDEFIANKRLLPLPPRELADSDFIDEGFTLLEATIAPQSPLAGATLVSSDFRRRHGGTVLAIRRGDSVTRSFVEQHELQEGDALLLLIERARRRLLAEDPALVITAESPAEIALREDDSNEEESKRSKTLPALAIVAGVVVAAALNLFPIYILALAGVIAMVGFGVISASRIYESVNWDIIFLLAGVIPLGLALQRSGGAKYLAEIVVSWGQQLPPILILGAFYLLTAALTNIVSNNATVILMTPIAVDVANQLGGNPLSFLLATTFAASTAFTTPVGYQTNLLVLTPGGYRFTDFLRLGGPLQVLLGAVTTLGIAWFWGV